ncbi:MAG: hypothetical protein AB8W78_09135 [Arsenophonus endosymbiont of Dermacentor nuttalli]
MFATGFISALDPLWMVVARKRPQAIILLGLTKLLSQFNMDLQRPLPLPTHARVISLHHFQLTC